MQAVGEHYPLADSAVSRDARAAIRLWVVVPAYNEAATIAEVLVSLRNIRCQVAVVDDGSTDNTADLAAAAGVVVLRHIVNLGQGAALQTGIQYALRNGGTHICTFDADGQHSVESISTLLNVLRSSHSDVVIGSRTLGSAIGMPLSKRVLLKLALFFTRLHCKLPLTDTHNGLRMMTRAAAERLRIRQSRMAHASEILRQIQDNGMKFTEAPVTINYTRYAVRKGQSVFGALRILADLFYARWTQ
ncbi:MAG: glycosyltransferase family 2 protein [Bryobacteraceae bacterium]|jgi:glycosyltransferase involved in cell wall biosynthesis